MLKHKEANIGIYMSNMRTCRFIYIFRYMFVYLCIHIYIYICMKSGICIGTCNTRK